MISSMLASATSKPSTMCLRRAGSSSQEFGPPANHVTRCRMNSAKICLIVELARLAIDQREKDHRERSLQRRELIQLIQDDVGFGVALDIDQQLDWLFSNRLDREFAEIPLILVAL